MIAETQDRKPKDILNALQGMALTFNPETAGDLEAVIQFEVTGDSAGTYHLQIEQRKCTFHNGGHENPTMTILTPAEVWLKIARKEMSGTMALMMGKYKTKGNGGLLMKMNSIFSRQITEDDLVKMGWMEANEEKIEVVK